MAEIDTCERRVGQSGGAATYSAHTHTHIEERAVSDIKAIHHGRTKRMIVCVRMVRERSTSLCAMYRTCASDKSPTPLKLVLSVSYSARAASELNLSLHVCAGERRGKDHDPGATKEERKR